MLLLLKRSDVMSDIMSVEPPSSNTVCKTWSGVQSDVRTVFHDYIIQTEPQLAESNTASQRRRESAMSTSTYQTKVSPA